MNELLEETEMFCHNCDDDYKAIVLGTHQIMYLELVNLLVMNYSSNKLMAMLRAEWVKHKGSKKQLTLHKSI